MNTLGDPLSPFLWFLDNMTLHIALSSLCLPMTTNSVVVKPFTLPALVSLSMKWAAALLAGLLGLLFESVVIIGVEAL